MVLMVTFPQLVGLGKDMKVENDIPLKIVEYSTRSNLVGQCICKKKCLWGIVQEQQTLLTQPLANVGLIIVFKRQNPVFIFIYIALESDLYRP